MFYTSMKARQTVKIPSHFLASNWVCFPRVTFGNFPNVLRIISPVIFNKTIPQKLSLKCDEILTWEALGYNKTLSFKSLQELDSLENTETIWNRDKIDYL